jgi:hypothetical protein
MLSYTGRGERYGKYTNQYPQITAANLATGQEYMNDNVHDILGERDWPFLEASDTSQLTVGSQQFYALPADADKVIDVTVLIGTVLWKPRELTARDQWDRVNYAQNVTSNIPQYYFIYGGKIGFWPTPSQGGNTIGVNYKKRVSDSSLPDYTAGAVFTATNGTATVIGTTTSWNQSMAGSYIQIASAQTTNVGDNFWYQISPSLPITGTQLFLTSPYKGTSITSGSAAYIIGQMSVLPENYHIMPVYWATANYWRLNGNNIPKAEQYEKLYDGKLKTFERDWGEKNTSPKLDNGIMETPTLNPNLTVTLS